MGGSGFWLEVTVILVLIAANGFFSAAEIAMVALRQSRLSQLVSEDRRGAEMLARMKEDPPRFLATVQVGVTIVGSTASAIGGVSAVAFLDPLLRQVLPAAMLPWSAFLALSITVAVISYLTLVLGELVPKSLALRYTETLACGSAPFILGLSRVTSPLIHILTWSTHLVMSVFGEHDQGEEAFTSEEEVKHMVREGAESGIFDEAERKLIHSVFEFTDTSVREVMVPRSDIHAIEKSTTPQAGLQDLVESGFSRAPVYDHDLEHIVGVLHIKDLLRVRGDESVQSVAAVMHPAFFVPDSMQISDLLGELQAKRVHMAIVLNEFGTVIGLATIEDLLEEIVGEIRDEFDIDEEAPIQELPDGSLLVDGTVPLSDLRERYDLPLEESQDYQTVAGFVLARLKRIPKGGEAIRHEGIKMTVVTIDSRRLRKVRIERPARKRKEGEAPKG